MIERDESDSSVHTRVEITTCAREKREGIEEGEGQGKGEGQGGGSNRTAESKREVWF